MIQVRAEGEAVSVLHYRTYQSRTEGGMIFAVIVATTEVESYPGV